MEMDQGYTDTEIYSFKLKNWIQYISLFVDTFTLLVLNRKVQRKQTWGLKLKLTQTLSQLSFIALSVFANQESEKILLDQRKTYFVQLIKTCFSTFLLTFPHVTRPVIDQYLGYLSEWTNHRPRFFSRSHVCGENSTKVIEKAKYLLDVVKKNLIYCGDTILIFVLDLGQDKDLSGAWQ